MATGGKRLRPAFCFWAFVGAGGDPDDPRVTDVAASHRAAPHVRAGARRRDGRLGRPARRADRAHVVRRPPTAARGDRGEARRFGEGAAILVGDFAFVYADQLLGVDAAPAMPPPVRRAAHRAVRRPVPRPRRQRARLPATGRDAELIERYKSGKYTVERPLHLGAALAGRLDELAEPFSRFGIPLGEAFQLRDDLLGVFGDPVVTGKPVGDDLREGKLTPLVAAAVAAAERPEHLDALARIGDPDLGSADVDTRSRPPSSRPGAVDEVERAIARVVGEALDRARRPRDHARRAATRWPSWPLRRLARPLTPCPHAAPTSVAHGTSRLARR